MNENLCPSLCLRVSSFRTFPVSGLEGISRTPSIKLVPRRSEPKNANTVKQYHTSNCKCEINSYTWLNYTISSLLLSLAISPALATWLLLIRDQFDRLNNIQGCPWGRWLYFVDIKLWFPPRYRLPHTKTQLSILCQHCLFHDHMDHPVVLDTFLPACGECRLTTGSRWRRRLPPRCRPLRSCCCRPIWRWRGRGSPPLRSPRLTPAGSGRRHGLEEGILL